MGWHFRVLHLSECLKEVGAAGRAVARSTTGLCVLRESLDMGVEE